MSLTSQAMLIYGGMLLKENMLLLYLTRCLHLCEIMTLGLGKVFIECHEKKPLITT